jgi:hypothetical protein
VDVKYGLFGPKPQTASFWKENADKNICWNYDQMNEFWYRISYL